MEGLCNSGQWLSPLLALKQVTMPPFSMPFTHRTKLRLPQLTHLAIAIWTIYLASRIPAGLQLLDSSEFVAAILEKTTVHPPGYPLYLWLGQAWSWAIGTFANTQTQLALLSLFLFTLYLWTLSRQCSNALLPYFIVVLPILSNSTVTQYAMTSDVFLLHGLLVSCIGYHFLRKSKASHNPTLLILAGLACAAHHTVVFLAPLFIYDLWTNFSKERLFSYLAVVLIPLILYASLLLRNTGSDISWPGFTNLSDLPAYFFRRDYGTFDLSIHAGSMSFFSPLMHFLMNFGLSFLSLTLVFIAGWSTKDQTSKRRLLIVAGSVGVYVLFWTIWVRPNVYGESGEIVERFYLMPLLLLGIAAGNVVETIRNRRLNLLLLSCAILCFLANFPKTHDRLQSMNSSNVEVVLQDIVDSVDGQKPSLVLAKGDSILFGLRALLLRDNRRNMTIVPIGLLCKSDFQGKLKEKYAALSFERTCAGTRDQTAFNFTAENLNNYNFFVIDEDIFNLPSTRAQVFNCGIHYSKSDKNELAFSINADTLTKIRASEVSKTYDPFIEIGLLSARGTIIYSRFLFSIGQFEQSLSSVQTLLALFPFHLGAKEVACRSLKKLNQVESAEQCNSEYRKLMTNSHPYFMQETHLKGI